MNAAAPPSPYVRIGGEPVVRAIANRFYDLLESDPAYVELRAIHAADLSVVRHGLTRFLCGWLGGPRDWFQRGTCIMSLHRAFPITPQLADQWATAAACAIALQEDLDTDIADAMAEALGHMARGMINFGLAPAQAHPR
ncbi:MULTISPECIES: globin [Sphingobium]|jgi:hemoglobin|uniref:Globin n=1 Tax=Sphingobium yanoikuyae TaxID=13690 RepID=A0A0J9D8Y9_SPHYA|nr:MULTISPECIES: globin [Sphingobium]ATP17052.1 globin [Sphingobium yanoikuyae]KMW32896.1 globin [Sphingobium yanoikuyae]QHD69944.1 globin [Sphingobium yanoikuyae]TKV44353.1 globin [Sphingobium sp. MP9-4]